MGDNLKDNIGRITGNLELSEACIGDTLASVVTETSNPKLAPNSIGCAELAESIENLGCKGDLDCVIPSEGGSSGIFGALPTSAVTSIIVAAVLVVVVLVVAVRMRAAQAKLRAQLDAARNRPSPTPSRRSISSLAWWDDEHSLATTVSADSISLSGIQSSAARMVQENPTMAAKMLEKVYTHIYRDIAPVDDGEAEDFALAASSLDEEADGYMAMAGARDDEVGSSFDSDDEYLEVNLEPAGDGHVHSADEPNIDDEYGFRLDVE